MFVMNQDKSVLCKLEDFVIEQPFYDADYIIHGRSISDRIGMHRILGQYPTKEQADNVLNALAKAIYKGQKLFIMPAVK